MQPLTYFAATPNGEEDVANGVTGVSTPFCGCRENPLSVLLVELTTYRYFPSG